MNTAEDKSVIRILCGALMGAIVENGILKSLVVDMAAGIPVEKMGVDEAGILRALTGNR